MSDELNPYPGNLKKHEVVPSGTPSLARYIDEASAEAMGVTPEEAKRMFNELYPTTFDASKLDTKDYVIGDGFQKALREGAKARMEQIMAQRTEILEAFIAKYGCFPEDAEQVLQRNMDGSETYYIRKKRSSVDAAEIELDNLRKFIDALIQDVCWGRGLPDDMDGGSVQDMAVKMGVLVEVPHKLPCDHIESCGCEGEEVDFLYQTPWNTKKS